MSELPEFLLARVAEDEQRASDASCEPWLLGKYAGAHAVLSADREFWIAQVGHTSDAYRDGLHIARWDPARVLRECEAKRRIVERYADHNTLFDHVVKVIRPASDVYDYTDGALWGLELALRHLAATYSDHPDYRDEWRV